MNIKTGQSLASAVDGTLIVVVKAPAGSATLTCGGVEMVPKGSPNAGGSATIAPEYVAPTQMGKRYVDEAEGLEVLCTKAGEGVIAIDGRALEIKAATPLPSSD